jgi:PAS domain S-box-containing protein
VFILRLRLIALLLFLGLFSLLAGILAAQHEAAGGRVWPFIAAVLVLDGVALFWLQRRILVPLARDLSRRSEGEAAMRRYALEVEDLYNRAPCGYHSLDAQGRFLRINDTALNWLGLRRDEVIGRPFRDFLTPASQALFDRTFEEGKKGGGVRDLEYGLLRKDGSVIYILLSADVRLDERGQYIASRSAYVDVTRRKQYEQRLTEVSIRLQAVLDAATEVAIIATDLHGRITLFNRGAERMLGYAAEEMLGQPTPWTAPGASGSLSGLHPSSFEWTCASKDRSQLVVNLVITALHDGNGQVSGHLSIATDITERRRAAEELARARDAAEHANRAKSAFLANMSHEIRTPLAAIVGLVEVMQQGTVTAEQGSQLQTLATAAESLLGLINGILDVSKIEAGKLALEARPFDPRALVNKVIEVLSLPARRKGLSLAAVVDPPVPVSVVGDAGRLRQVLLNLVGNAVKFTEHGEVVVELARRASEGVDTSAPEVELHFSVRDTGVGIPAEKLQRIFQPFEQADESTTRTHGGTGLGLTISSRLVERMGGRLAVSSEVGKGSTFSFQLSLPIAEYDKVTRWQGDKVTEDSTPSSVTLSPLNILLAEDNPVNQQVLSLLLVKAGHKVRVVDNGRKALEALGREKFDLVLMDVQMPEMDGLRCARLIRAHEKAVGGHVPIIAVTANALEGERQRCLQAGMDDYLTKPVRSQELFRLIQELSGRRHFSTQERDGSGPPWLEPLREMGFDQEASAGLIRTFVETVPGRLLALNQAVAAGDLAGVAQAAHKIRGSLLVFAAQPAIEIANRLESLARQGRLDLVPAALAELEGVVEQLVRSMQESNR